MDHDWKKSSFSDNSGGNCVEVKQLRGGWFVRDSKDPDGSVLLFTPDEKAAFIAGVKAGEFD